ncbi:MAG: SDR family NAD(P)-dependent oxidoreductase, partial [Cypionkella sp.]|nr:SDR family NAD(P)-dependent oxidoreductase [Cypionkella sp.]
MALGPFAPDCLKGRSAIVTGGGSGIGFAIAQTLSEAGAKVALVSRNLDRLQSAAQVIRSGGAEVRTVAADVREPEAVQA